MSCARELRTWAANVSCARELSAKLARASDSPHSLDDALAQLSGFSEQPEWATQFLLVGGLDCLGRHLTALVLSAAPLSDAHFGTIGSLVDRAPRPLHEQHHLAHELAAVLVFQ